jgi:hypothetical protein
MPLVWIGIGLLLAGLAFGLLRQAFVYRRLSNWRDGTIFAFFGCASAIGATLTFAELLGLIS